MKFITQKQVVKLLNKKITVASVTWILIFFSILVIIFSLKKSSYAYIDTNNIFGRSEYCYYDGNTRELKCKVDIVVKQYNKE